MVRIECDGKDPSEFISFRNEQTGCGKDAKTGRPPAEGVL